MSTGPSRWCGPARKTSATTSIGRSTATSLARASSGGRIVGWKHSITGSAVMARWLPPSFQKGVDPDGVDCAAGHPLRHPELARGVQSRRAAGRDHRLLARRRPEQQRVRHREFHRGAGDARRARTRSPFRRAHLDKTPRLQAALDLARKVRLGHSRCRRAADAGSPRRSRSPASSPPSWNARSTRTARCSCGAYAARSTPESSVNPDTVMAQLQGGLIFGLDRGALRRNHDRRRAGSSSPTSTTTGCCASTRRRRSMCI